MRRVVGGLLLGLLVLLATASPAAPVSAAEPLEIVHSETVQLRPNGSTLTVSFTDWPLQAGRSLDFTFEPAGGIAGRTGTLRMIAPSGEPVGVGWLDDSVDVELPRHPRAHDVWGLDIVALPEEGTWRFEFTVEGPDETSTGSLPIEVGPRPGPPETLSWILGSLPWIALVPVLAYGWIRTRPVRLRRTSAWTG